MNAPLNMASLCCVHLPTMESYMILKLLHATWREISCHRRRNRSWRA